MSASDTAALASSASIAARPRTVRPRLIAAVDGQLCDACGLCMPLCPTLAIEMRREGLRIVDERCTGCEKCIAPCPVGALTMIEPLHTA